MKREKAKIESWERNDLGRSGRGAQHPTRWVARRLHRSAFRYFCFGPKHVLSPHIAWQRDREDSNRGWLLSSRSRRHALYAQVSARDLMMELAELSPERSAPMVESGGTDYGNADTEMRVSRKTEIRESLRSGRRKRCDPVEFFALVEFLATQDAWMTQLARFAEFAEPRTN